MAVKAKRDFRFMWGCQLMEMKAGSEIDPAFVPYLRRAAPDDIEEDNPKGPEPAPEAPTTPEEPHKRRTRKSE